MNNVKTITSAQRSRQNTFLNDQIKIRLPPTREVKDSLEYPFIQIGNTPLVPG